MAGKRARSMGDLTNEDAAEVMRKKYRYRELILSGKLVLPYRRAAQLLGPDCLYHLYSVQGSKKTHRRGASRPAAGTKHSACTG